METRATQPLFDIRQMKLADFDRTQRLLTGIFNTHTIAVRRHMGASFTKDPHRPTTFIATAPGDPAAPVGAVQTSWADSWPGMGTGYSLQWLCVRPDWRGCGLGAALVRRVEAHVLEALHGKPGFIALCDATKRENPRSEFYERLGFSPDHPWPARDRHGDAVLMKKLNARPGR